MGIAIKTSIRTTPSFNLLWCVNLVTNLATKPNTDTKFRGIPPRASQANYTTPSNGWNSHNWLIKSKAAHHITSDLTTWVLILNTTGMMISSLVMTLVFQFLIRFLLLSPHQQLVSPYVTYFVFHPCKIKNKKNLVSISQFCKTNNASIKFFLFRFIVKDLNAVHNSLKAGARTTFMNDLSIPFPRFPICKPM